MKIRIQNFTRSALSEKSGLQLRKEINDSLENNPKEKIVLDFENINLFATPFFNSCIGYFILNNKKDVVDKIIEIQNISDLGTETYTHSYNNALDILEKGNLQDLNEIIENTMKEI